MIPEASAGSGEAPGGPPTPARGSGLDLTAIEQRVAAATPGPWFYNSYSGIFSQPRAQSDDRDVEWDSDVAWVPAHHGDTATGRHADDAEFIAEARADIPLLLAECRRLEAERDHWRELCAERTEQRDQARAALIEAAEVFDLSDPDGHRLAIYAPEDEDVLLLCECHGFRAVIDSAVRQWRQRDPVGAFTQGACVGTVLSTLKQIDAALAGVAAPSDPTHPEGSR